MGAIVPVTTLTAAPGAKGLPPMPPTEPSKRLMPVSSADSRLAIAVPRVSWKCAPHLTAGRRPFIA